MVLSRQIAYSEDPPKGFPGQLARGTDMRDCVTRVNSVAGVAKVVRYTIAATWAAADDLTTTLAGIAEQTTADDGVLANIRDKHLTELQANVEMGKLFTFAAVDTDKIDVTGLEIGEGSGEFLDYAFAAAETTAGNGTWTAAQTVAAANAGNLKFGVGVALDTTDARGKKVTLPAATGFKFGGISVHTHAIDGRKLKAGIGIPAKNSFSALMSGYIFATAEEAVNPGDPLFVRHTANGTLKPGGLRKSADTARADAVPGHWVTGASAGGLAIVRVAAE